MNTLRHKTIQRFLTWISTRYVAPAIVGFIIQFQVSCITVENHNDRARGVPLADVIGEQADVPEGERRVPVQHQMAETEEDLCLLQRGENVDVEPPVNCGALRVYLDRTATSAAAVTIVARDFLILLV